MQIVLIGAGGVGGFLGALLAEAGHEVAFLARGKHLATIRERGLELRSKQFGDIHVKPLASDDSADLPQADVVIVAVKMYDFSSAAQSADVVLKPDGLAVTIQNGLDAPNDLARVLGRGHVVVGTASIESTILEPGVVGHLVPIHRMTLSELNGAPTAQLEALSAMLLAAKINVSIAPNGNQALWDKAAALIPIATITASVAAGIGAIFALQETRALLEALMAEAAAVAKGCGYDVGPSQTGFMAMMQQASTVQPAFTTSMDRDFQHGKRTELEWLTGKLVRLAEERKVDAPAHRTLYAVLKLKEQRALASANQLVGARG
ncbi:MAG: 2-dehydropantoate 2-reductase [Chloroflexi bacterium]|nr:MAG: 2-dehydropantoate 2-reductase [Chloroflexota bacterium]TME48725.1 MAG: 2-dehydropantoate 2-reductase [Chloroflexota bacterium]